MAKTTIAYKGVQYTWTGESWYETKTYIRPCQTLTRELNRELSGYLAVEDMKSSDPKKLRRMASRARDAMQYQRAEKLAQKALKLWPGDLATLTVLSSIYRATGNPQKAW